MIKAVLFDLGSTLLEFENQPWEELIRQGIEAVYDALHVHGAVLPGRELFYRGFTTSTAQHGELQSNRSSRWKSACFSKKPPGGWD